MRKKLSPAPLPRRDPSSTPRMVVPATSARAFVLPTAAALLAVAAVACAGRSTETVRDDPPPRHALATSTASTTSAASTPTSAPSSAPSVGGMPIIDPDPHELDGEPAMVMPKPPSPPVSLPAATPPPIVPKPYPVKGGLGFTHPTLRGTSSIEPAERA